MMGVVFLMFRLVKESCTGFSTEGRSIATAGHMERFTRNFRRNCARYIFIDGKPTLEFDFSAYHILMLYHLQGHRLSRRPLHGLRRAGNAQGVQNRQPDRNQRSKHQEGVSGDQGKIRGGEHSFADGQEAAEVPHRDV